jgi:hypothetical protein
MSTLNATFEYAADAKKAAGALFDYGIPQKDLTITSKYECASHLYNKEIETDVSRGENEGWPARRAAAMVMGKRQKEAEEKEADTGYREADEAERYAKSGISITTPGDAFAGALKGAAIGLCIGTLAGFLWLMPGHIGSVRAGAAFAFVMGVAAFGLVAGAILGTVVGYLKDQGIPRNTDKLPPLKISVRPVLLAVNLSSSDIGETEAKKLVSKYNAISIDMS